MVVCHALTRAASAISAIAGGNDQRPSGRAPAHHPLITLEYSITARVPSSATAIMRLRLSAAMRCASRAPNHAARACAGAIDAHIAKSILLSCIGPSGRPMRRAQPVGSPPVKCRQQHARPGLRVSRPPSTRRRPRDDDDTHRCQLSRRAVRLRHPIPRPKGSTKVMLPSATISAVKGRPAMLSRWQIFSG
jgi:hypothetical protein